MNLRVLTYNIRHGQGLGFKYSLKEIAELIISEKPDFVGLNEVYRIPLLDQPKMLAKLTGMNYIFQRNMYIGAFFEYGNMILSKEKFEDVEDIKLPRHFGIERRGLLLVDAKVCGKIVHFGTTHLSLGRHNRKPQIDFIKDKLREYSGVILSGDFNASILELQPLSSKFKLSGEFKTYPSNRPSRQFDYIFYDCKFSLVSSGTKRFKFSDHLPIFAGFKMS